MSRDYTPRSHSQVPQTWDHFLTCSLGGDHGGGFLSPQDNFPVLSFQWGDYQCGRSSISRVTSQLSPAAQVLTEIALSMTTQPQRCCPRQHLIVPQGHLFPNSPKLRSIIIATVPPNPQGHLPALFREWGQYGSSLHPELSQIWGHFHSCTPKPLDYLPAHAQVGTTARWRFPLRVPNLRMSPQSPTDP